MWGAPTRTTGCERALTRFVHAMRCVNGGDQRTRGIDFADECIRPSPNRLLSDLRMITEDNHIHPRAAGADRLHRRSGGLAAQLPVKQHHIRRRRPRLAEKIVRISRLTN
jgi:hypothetical protein